MPTKKTAADREAALRHHLLELLNGGHAHADFDAAVRNVPVSVARQAAQRRRTFAMGDPGASAHRAMGHSGVLARSQSQIAGLAERLLAGNSRAAR